MEAALPVELDDAAAADPTTGYARAVIARKLVAGPHVRSACQRHLDDLVEGPKRGLTWKPEVAARAFRFFAALQLADGDHAGQPFYLELWQCFIVGSLFGWIGADGFRRFRTAYIEIGKGNGKTPLAAGIGLYLLMADGEAGAEVYSAAVSRDQAAICFRDAKRFVEVNSALSRRLIVGERNLAFAQTGSFLRPLSAEGKTLDGKRVHGAIVDELHEHDSAIVVDKLRAGTKGRRQALIVEITNSGSNRLSVCYDHHRYSVAVLGAKVGDKDFNDSWFAYVCALDQGDDWMKDPRCWLKANPNLGISIQEKYLSEQVHEARGMPSKQNLVARLNFCVWTDAISAWISREKWDAVQSPEVALEQFADRDVLGALDLSSRNDLTALVLFAPQEAEIAGDLVAEFWAPEEGLREREDRDRAPYGQWKREGHLQVTAGASVDYAVVARRIAELRAKLRLRCLAYDRWRIRDLVRELEAIGVDAREMPEKETLPDRDDGVLWIRGFGQGFKDMAPAVQAIEGAILNARLRIRPNPVLTWNAASAVLESDAAGNQKFTKRKATGRIDGIVAATMAVGVHAALLNGMETMKNIEQGFVNL